MKKQTITPVAFIRNDFKEKFGIPRQSGRAPSLISRIVFEWIANRNTKVLVFVFFPIKRKNYKQCVIMGEYTANSYIP
jgi:hypothetical protein